MEQGLLLDETRSIQASRIDGQMRAKVEQRERRCLRRLVRHPAQLLDALLLEGRGSGPPLGHPRPSEWRMGDWR